MFHTHNDWWLAWLNWTVFPFPSPHFVTVGMLTKYVLIRLHAYPIIIGLYCVNPTPCCRLYPYFFRSVFTHVCSKQHFFPRCFVVENSNWSHKLHVKSTTIFILHLYVALGLFARHLKTYNVWESIEKTAVAEVTISFICWIINPQHLVLWSL